jgi:beta-galactosidase
MKLIQHFLLLILFSFTAQAVPPQWDRLYHGVAYYPELWPESDIDRDIAEMKNLGINMARMGEFAWSKMEANEGKIDVSFFRKVMDRLHGAGIRVVMCTPTATPPVWLTHGRPDRCFVDAAGAVMVHGARQHVSYEHPEVRVACMRIVEAMAKDLGDHPALIAWQIDNELKCHVAEDFSDAAVAEWHRWLECLYGTIDRLNEAWGTDIWSQRYQNFGQVPAPEKTPFLHNASLSTAYRTFNRERIAEFADEQAAILRRHSKVPITHNSAVGFSIGHERMFRNLDFASFDDYPGRDDWRRWVLANDLFRSLKPGVPHWMMETSTAHNGWLGNHPEPVHPPGFLTAEAVATYALGGQTVSYWLWRQQRAGAELPHSAVMSAWFKPGLGYNEVMEVEKVRKVLEPILADSKPVPPEVGVTWSDRGRAMLQTEAIGAGRGVATDHNDLVSFWHMLLLDHGYDRGFLMEEHTPPPSLKVLVTPAMPAVDDGFVSRLKPWIEAGGVWICISPTGTRTAEHTVPTHAGLGLVDELAGVETMVGFPAQGTETRGEALGTTAPIAGWCSVFRPHLADTTVLGSLKSPLLGGDRAFITERRFGKGSVVLVGGRPTGDEGWKMMVGLVERCARKTIIKARPEVTRGTLLVPRISSAGEVLWIVVNLDGKGGSVNLPRVAGDGVSVEELPAGPLKIAAYGWRVLAF